MLDRYSKTPSQGTLYLTATHLIFVDPDAKKETWVCTPQKKKTIFKLLIRLFYQILHNHIASLEKLALTTTGSPLLIRCKIFLSVTFVIPKERDCHEIYTTLQQLSQPNNIEALYCFTYTSSFEGIEKSEGWNYFNLDSEYQRMGLPNDHWCLTTINKEYEVCCNLLSNPKEI